MKTIIQAEHLTYIYSEGTPFQRSAVKDLSCEIYQGELLGVMGHTGSGKSTFIQHLNGLLRPSSGRILLDGQDIWAQPKNIREVRFRVGLVFQYPEYQLFEETVYQDIAFGPKNMGFSGDELDRRVRTAAFQMGLTEKTLEQSPFSLSGGQKRRVAIAGVLAMEPEVLVLDEPTAGLDPRGREQLLEQIRAYHQEKEKTVVLVSHSMDDIAAYAQRILVLDHGKILLSGTPGEVFSQGAQLLQAGLDVPQAARIAMELRRLGVPVPEDIYTLEALTEALIVRKGAKGRC